MPKQKDKNSPPAGGAGGKTILLIRHAKSDWGNPALDDMDRPLNERGKRDAPEMAKRLLDKKIKIDLFVSSPAKRAAKTAKIIAGAFHRHKDEIIIDKNLYLAGPEAFYSTIENTDDQYKSIAIFAHNYGITDFANLLTEVRVDNIPTCGVFAVEASTKQWSEFRKAPKKFLFFDYPSRPPKE